MDEQCPTKQRELSAAEHEGFSSLLEPLLHHVFSFLPFWEVVKASAVCRPWLQAYSSFPVLDFRNWDLIGRQDRHRGPSHKRLVEFVDATMTRFQERRLKIDSFNIQFFLSLEPQEHLLEKWMAIALDRNAEDIYIHVDGHPDRYVYCNLERILAASSVKSLSVGGRRLDLPSCDASLNLSSLRSLTLSSCTMDDWMFGRLMARCHLLEFLSLDDCYLTEMKVSGLPNIKGVHLQPARCTRLVEIEAPSLESFKYISFSCDETCVLTMSNCPNLKSLQLVGVAKSGSWFQELLCRFPSLQDLTIIWCSALQRIEILNPLIESIEIGWCHSLTKILYATPELKSFRLNLSEKCHLPSLRMMTGNSVAELFVEFYCLHMLPTWFTQLKEFLVRNRKYFTSLRLCAQTRDRDFGFELHSSVRCQWLGVLVCNLPLLNIARRGDLPSIISEEELVATIDPTNVNGLICTPHPTTVTVAAALSEEDFFQFFWEKVAEHSCSRPQCTSYPDRSPGGQDDVKIEIVTNRKQLPEDLEGERDGDFP